jgi:hypothetical protein
MALGGVVGLGTHAAWSLVDALPLGARTNFLWWTAAALVATIVTLDPQPEAGWWSTDRLFPAGFNAGLSTGEKRGWMIDGRHLCTN